MNENPRVSVIVPCRNEVNFIARCLDSIRASDYPAERLEVIVADGMSDDGTRQAVASYAERNAGVRLIDNPERITPVGLNRAIEAAHGDVIVRLDAHAEMAADYISRCVAALESTGAANAGGVRVERAQDRGPFADAIVAALTCRFGVGNAHYRFGASEGRWVDTVFGGCWRREIFDRIGKFNPKLARSQDIEFNQRLRRAGGRIWMTPDAVTYYYTRSRLGSFIRHNVTNGIWSVLPFAYSDVTPVRLRHLAPLGLVLSTSVLVAAAMVTPALKWAPALTLAPYALANLAASVQLSLQRKTWRFLILLPLTFLCLHFPYGAGSMWGAVRVAAIMLGRRVLGRRVFGRRVRGKKWDETRVPVKVRPVKA